MIHTYIHSDSLNQYYMLIFDVFIFLFSISFVCHTWNMTQLQILTLLFKNNNILGNKKIRVGPKIRVGRIIGNETYFFLGFNKEYDVHY